MPSHLGHGMHVPYLDRGPKAQSTYHTLTNLPFEMRPKLQNRYEYVTRPSSVHQPLEPRTKTPTSPRRTSLGFVRDVKKDEQKEMSGVEYAKFLKENERTLGPSGFLDSRRYNHTFNVRGLTVPPPRAGVAALKKPDSEPTNVINLAHKTAAYEKEFERRMKIIEDHMWQHKQEEREIKRVEGDVIKKKRLLQRNMREYENAMAKKMLDEEKRLNTTIEQTEKVKVEATHAKEERTKQRIAKAHDDLQQAKAKLRKNALIVTDAERQYRLKLTELETRKIEIDRITREFEEKLKRKEEATFRLTKQLGELSIAMNMESMKGRVAATENKKQERVSATKYIHENRHHDLELEKKLAKSDGLNRAAQNRRRQHSANMVQKKDHLSERGREGDRRVTDTKNMMENNIANQKKLKEDKDAEGFYKQKKQYERNVEEHVLRKNIALQQIQNMRREMAMKKQENWEKTYENNYRDFTRRRNEDLIRTFHRIVNHDNEMDHQLYQKCRQFDFGRKSQEQTLKKMEEQLNRARLRNNTKLRQDMTESDSKEHDIQNKIAKTKAELFRAQNQRSSAEYMLRRFRGAAKETEYIYNERLREQKRLMRIGARTDTYLEQQTIPVM
ncbi:uncharacterized protein LOC120348058 [Styela clava]